MKRFKFLEAITTEPEVNDTDNDDDTDELSSDHLTNNLKKLLASHSGLEDLMDIVSDAHKEVDKEDNPDKQGMIRTVKNAHLVYKRKTQEGTFEELWIYNSTKDTFRDETDIKLAILSGTDIRSELNRSEDGTQTYSVVRLGNAMLLHIIGLPS